MRKSAKSKSVEVESKAIGMVMNAKAGEGAIADVYTTYASTEVPAVTNLVSVFTKCRTMIRDNYWLRNYIKLRRGVLNYGMTMTPSGATKAGGKKKAVGQKDIDKLNQWLDLEVVIQSTPVEESDKKTLGVPSVTPVSNRTRLNKFIFDAWNELLQLDSIIGYWNNAGVVTVLAPEKCRYNDIMGIETLFFTHGLSPQQIKLLPSEEQQRFLDFPELPIDATQGDSFRVLKMERLGNGLSVPSLYSAMMAVGTLDSMQTSESSYAFGGRTKWRHHKVGHSIPQGPMAGKPTHFWKPSWGDGIRKVFADKKGFIGDYIGRHDHTVEFPHEDIAFFDEEKWKSPEHRLIEWAGPLAKMMIAEKVLPFLMPLLKADIVELRTMMKDFLEAVINNGFAPAVPIKIDWSNLIFNDAAVLQQYLKDGITSNTISHETWRENVGFDEDKEQARLAAQLAVVQATPEFFIPPYDPNHGATGPGGPAAGPTGLQRGGSGKNKPTT